MNNQSMDMNSIYGIPGCPGGNCNAQASNVQPLEDIAYSSNLASQVPSLEDIAGYNITGQTPNIDGKKVYSEVTERARLEQDKVAQNLADKLPQSMQYQNVMEKNMQDNVTDNMMSYKMDDAYKNLDKLADFHHEKYTATKDMHHNAMTNKQTSMATNNNAMSNQENNMTQNNLAPITPTTEPMPLNVASLQYLNGFMRTQIGRVVKVDFLIGSNTNVDRTGVLLAVGANYILINEIETDDILACDFYNIKFVKFYY